MIDREVEIIDAAVTLFLRYGVKRTGMSDIAREAGISRQTLYNAFANKDEVLRATIRLFTRRALAQIDERLGASETLYDQMGIVFDHFVVRPFEMLQRSPNAEDIVSGMNAASREELAANDRAFQSVLERVLSPHEKAIAQAGLPMNDLAEATQIAVSAAKDHAADRRHLDRLLEAHKSIIIAIAGG